MARSNGRTVRRRAWRAPDRGRIEAALSDQSLDPGDALVEQTEGMVSAWLDSPLRAELAGARISAEVPFVLSVGETMLRGELDLLAERPDGSVVVVDYKTDRLRGRVPADAAARYGVQRDIYALAAQRFPGKEVSRAES